MAPKDPNAPSRSRTETQQGQTQQTVPRMPHERDESANHQGSAEPTAGQIGKIAHEDQVRGIADTSRSAETDATYHRLHEAPPGPQRPADTQDSEDAGVQPP